MIPPGSWPPDKLLDLRASLPLARDESGREIWKANMRCRGVKYPVMMDIDVIRHPDGETITTTNIEFLLPGSTPPISLRRIAFMMTKQIQQEHRKAKLRQ